MSKQTPDLAINHSIVEDIVAIFMSAIMIAIGIYFFKLAGMLSGGITGLTLLFGQFTDLPFSAIFIALNFPFFVLAFFKLSKTLAIKSLLCAVLVAMMSESLYLVFKVGFIHPVFAAISGGFLFGMGLLALIRHQASLGGFTILALIIQNKYHISAGRVQLVIDSSILLLSFFLTSWNILMLSLIGVFTLNLVIALYHKKGRYRGLS